MMPATPSLAVALAGSAVAAIVDARTGLIPDRLTACSAGAVLATALAFGTLATAAAGAVTVAGTLLAVYALTRGRGLGLGDVKLGLTIGGGCGPAFGLGALGTAFVVGALYACGLVALQRAGRHDAIPFAPFLAVGTLAVAVRAAIAA